MLVKFSCFVLKSKALLSSMQWLSLTFTDMYSQWDFFIKIMQISNAFPLISLGMEFEGYKPKY